MANKINKEGDLVLRTDIIDPHKLDNVLNFKQNIKDLNKDIENKNYKTTLSYIIRNNNYSQFDIKNNILDRYNKLDNYNNKLLDEIKKKKFKKKKEKNIGNDNEKFNEKIYNNINKYLKSSLKYSNKVNKHLIKNKNKKLKKLRYKNNLLQRKIEYDIQDIHTKNNVLIYIRYILYTIVAILILIIIINYIK